MTDEAGQAGTTATHHWLFCVCLCITSASWSSLSCCLPRFPRLSPISYWILNRTAQTVPLPRHPFCKGISYLVVSHTHTHTRVFALSSLASTSKYHTPFITTTISPFKNDKLRTSGGGSRCPARFDSSRLVGVAPLLSCPCCLMAEVRLVARSLPLRVPLSALPLFLLRFRAYQYTVHFSTADTCL